MMQRHPTSPTSANIVIARSEYGDRISGNAQTVPTRLLFIVNVAWFFRSHRLPLANEAIRCGYEVHLAAAFRDEEERQQFEALGITTHAIPFERSGTAFATEVGAIVALRRLLAKLRPALCHNVSIKPVIYGGTLSRLYGIPTVNAISGLGYSYIAKGFKASLRRQALNRAYAFATTGPASKIIVQNNDDYRFFKDELRVDEGKLALIRGSGVDLRLFDAERPSSSRLVVLPARMLADKGVREFVEAARTLRRKGISARFVLVGGLDHENRAGLTQAEMEALTKDGAVEHWGHRTDIPEILTAAQIVCLPSYREGFPKSLLEAAAAARAIVTTDVPGCREIVEHGLNGLLVPARDSTALAAALEQLLSNEDLCTEMGRRGRSLVEQYFSLDIVVGRTMELYRELLQ